MDLVSCTSFVNSKTHSDNKVVKHKLVNTCKHLIWVPYVQWDSTTLTIGLNTFFSVFIFLMGGGGGAFSKDTNKLKQILYLYFCILVYLNVFINYAMVKVNFSD